MGYANVWEHYGEGWHTDVDWSSVIKDLYSLELDSWIFIRPLCFLFCFSFIGLSNAPISFTIHFRWPLSVESCESLYHRKLLGIWGSACVEMMTTLHRSTLTSIVTNVWSWDQCVPSEAYRRLCTIDKYDHFCYRPFKAYLFHFLTVLTF